MSVLLLLSLPADGAPQLMEGPRRDVLELARAVDGKVIYRGDSTTRSGWAARLAGPHVRQAWTAARQTRDGDTVFADGEHIGVPLLFFLRVLRRKPRRVVMLAHFASRRWKRALLFVATRLGVPGTLIVHSATQQERLRRVTGRQWPIRLLPYQVDTTYWAKASEPESPPLFVAVGAENRDYRTLLAAAAGAPYRFVIAAGSHWARERAVPASAIPPNVELIEQPLGFGALRDLYSRAICVVVPLRDVENQSGVTTILEAMSMSRPVIVSATEGQRECVAGPLVRRDGTLDWAATGSRGPGAFGEAFDGDASTTGLYVLPGDVLALRRALDRIVTLDPRAMGKAGRKAAERFFSTEDFVARFAAELVAARQSAPAPIDESEMAAGASWTG